MESYQNVFSFILSPTGRRKVYGSKTCEIVFWPNEFIDKNIARKSVGNFLVKKFFFVFINFVEISFSFGILYMGFLRLLCYKLFNATLNDARNNNKQPVPMTRDIYLNPFPIYIFLIKNTFSFGQLFVYFFWKLNIFL